MEQTTTTGLNVLRASRLTTTTGRNPPCSEPCAGSRLALKTSARRTCGMDWLPLQIVFLKSQGFPVAILKILGEQFRFFLVVGVFGHASECRVDLPTLIHLEVGSNCRND